MSGVTRVEAALHPSAAAEELVQVSSTKFTKDAAVDPWDDTVSVPGGTNRLLLDFVGGSNGDPTGSTSVLGPGVEGITLAEATPESPSNFSSNETVHLFYLLNANFPGTTGNKTLRFNPPTVRVGRRRVIFLTGASQTIHRAAAEQDADANLVLSLTRSSGSFPIGTRVYAACYAEHGSGTYTITGDVTEVDDEAVNNATSTLQDVWGYAAGTLGIAKATVTATFAASVSGIRRKQGIIAAVEPV